MRRIDLVELGGIIMVCFIALFFVIITVRFYLPKSNDDSIQLLIECKEQQDALQEQINALNIRIKNTDKTIIMHWRRLQEQLNSTQVKEAPTTNE